MAGGEGRKGTAAVPRAGRRRGPGAFRRQQTINLEGIRLAKEKNRWVILAALVINNICLGATYVWSIFNTPLMEANGWQLSQVSLAYSLLLLVTFFANPISGQLQNKVGPQKLMLVALVFWGGGWFLTGFATSLPQLYLFFSLVVGIGTGFGYNTVVSTIPRWFPDRKGLANGLVIGASGLSPLPFAPIGYFLLDRFGVQNSFKGLGIIFLVLMAATFWLITAPPQGWKPEGWVPPPPPPAPASSRRSAPARW